MAQPFAQDRLVRKEVSLGVIRELPVPEAHIGTRLFAPITGVASDDVIFDYVIPDTSGLAPARAEDAESEMARKDDTVGSGRASIIDWAIKDHYDASDVTRYRELLQLKALAADSAQFPLTIQADAQHFQEKLAKDTAKRRRRLDNRIEWLIQESLWKGVVAYNDGKVKFSVDWQRPAAQQNASVTAWTDPASDPINNILDVREYMRDNHEVRIARAVLSEKILLNILNSTKFAARAGFAGAANPNLTVDPFYTIPNWGWEAARDVVKAATGVEFIPYDAVYRKRALGSTTTTSVRFSPEDKILFLPSDEDVQEIASESEIGFGKTLTSPHPEGNFTPGFYEWEKTDVDPWGHDRGNGVKAFPVFPHLDLTYVLKVL